MTDDSYSGWRTSRNQATSGSCRIAARRDPQLCQRCRRRPVKFPATLQDKRGQSRCVLLATKGKARVVGRRWRERTRERENAIKGGGRGHMDFISAVSEAMSLSIPSSLQPTAEISCRMWSMVTLCVTSAMLLSGGSGAPLLAGLSDGTELPKRVAVGTAYLVVCSLSYLRASQAPQCR
ncbi:hypothetical protein NDU88_007292 [Pleurodeles waltl]|uniref:Uncharacterized protein n=1 Tax=Pleurodeles waltl TaxID=8319 RepID=A0AAV7VTE5_PLEWA|nr:hypothetical protein NDU88_007292 [Pleurodeles waltl]